MAHVRPLQRTSAVLISYGLFMCPPGMEALTGPSLLGFLAPQGSQLTPVR